MGRKPKNDENMVYCMCPSCKTIREKVNGRYNIIKRGYERNGFARFFCMGCRKWFNEKTGEAMEWYER